MWLRFEIPRRLTRARALKSHVPFASPAASGRRRRRTARKRGGATTARPPRSPAIRCAAASAKPVIGPASRASHFSEHRGELRTSVCELLLEAAGGPGRALATPLPDAAHVRAAEVAEFARDVVLAKPPVEEVARCAQPGTVAQRARRRTIHGAAKRGRLRHRRRWDTLGGSLLEQNTSGYVRPGKAHLRAVIGDVVELGREAFAGQAPRLRLLVLRGVQESRRGARGSHLAARLLMERRETHEVRVRRCVASEARARLGAWRLRGRGREAEVEAELRQRNPRLARGQPGRYVQARLLVDDWQERHG
mmetsp:Transcript_118273/g.339358  ORF Transcript_118273/g.339358 Transcript_118273/m.339358 type:complete len:307 (+) Transcript_118273:94-1014(+)